MMLEIFYFTRDIACWLKIYQEIYTNLCSYLYTNLSVSVTILVKLVTFLHQFGLHCTKLRVHVMCTNLQHRVDKVVYGCQLVATQIQLLEAHKLIQAGYFADVVASK